jgi:predicted site-specific integrase-resolvase
MNYSIEQCSQLLGLSQNTIYRLIRTGKLGCQPYEHRTDPIIVSRTQILTYLTSKYPILTDLVQFDRETLKAA